MRDGSRPWRSLSLLSSIVLNGFTLKQCYDWPHLTRWVDELQRSEATGLEPELTDDEMLQLQISDPVIRLVIDFLSQGQTPSGIICTRNASRRTQNVVYAKHIRPTVFLIKGLLVRRVGVLGDSLLLVVPKSLRQ